FAGRVAIRMAGRYETIPDERLRYALDGYLGSNLIRKEDFNEAIAEIITSRKAERSEFVQGVLIDFLFEKHGLGDPRISPENWAGIEESATTRVIQWLSREDINFFFELLLRDKDDKHGRKAFWLQYVDKVARSRALISKEDIRDHSVRLREMEEKGRSYGRLDGVNSSSSFILDFGRVVVVEFSEVGNACYIYTKNDFLELVPDFWAKDVSFRSLKNQSKVSERITRSVKDWQGNARQILSRYGVRRG
ncbi:MAG: EH signature domain-containing protein, partial [Deltaproteobacteria bacterium]